MTAQELNTYINRVLGNSIRCLLPSYWWKRLLTQIVEYVDSVEENADKKINDLKKTVDHLDNLDVEFLSDYIKSKAVFKVTAKSGRDVTVVADDETIIIPAGRTMRISALKNFQFKDGSYSSPVNVDKVDVSNAYTASFTSMEEMFYYCTSLTSLDLSGFDTSNVTDMSGMFGHCESLTSLDVSSFDTSKVTDMSGMFDYMPLLTSLDVSGLDTSNVTDMNRMFNVIRLLTSLDLSSFDTSNVTDMSSMFSGCSSLTSLDLSGFDTSKVTNMRYMFSSCTSLTSLDLSGFDTSNVTDMYYMFGYCPKLEELILGEGFFKAPRVTLIDFSDVPWNEESAIQSLVTNSYDRATNGLPTLEVKLHSNVYAYLTDEHKATLTSKGYTVTSVG